MKRILVKLKIHTMADFYGLAVQFVKFGIVGVSNTLINLLVYYLLVRLGLHYILAYAAGFLVSVVNAFYWNNKYVFKKQERGTIKPFIKTICVYGATFLLSVLLLYLLVDILEVSELLAPVINLCLTVPLNFFLNKFWALKE